ncbi:helix-turn-helix domain-containing protein [Eubacteriales bacterium OttesenSCG-928-N13]|nr:helix-turn-helix domain-containing protein [Eubacteriales bacterium OttesenSCG-928-N13]
MLRTLIVEDEVLARLGLHQLVDWNALGFELLEDAKTGSEALEKIRILRPQLVILDLNIPEINGIEIQRYIVDNAMPCQTVVISCNDDFTTVKEIMRLGAFDFLRKLNLSSESLSNVLLRVKQRINSDVEIVQASDLPRIRQASYEYLFKSTDASFFAVPYCSAVCVVTNRTTQLLSDYAASCVRELGSTDWQGCLITRGERGIYLLSEQARFHAFYESLQERLEALWGTQVYLGVWNGRIDSLATLTHALASVECTNVYACYDSGTRVITICKQVSFSHTAGFDFGMICTHLKLALANLSEKDIGDVLSAFFQALRGHDMLAVNLLKRMYMDILGLFSSTAQRLQGNIEDVYVRGENYHYQTLLRMNSIDMTEQWFHEFAHAFVERFFIQYKSRSSDILHSVFTYIDSNIAQPIHLSAVAKHIGISENYLSSYFKKEIGENFVAYVNIRKIEKAKELLCANCLVYQVSESLGFENNTYFTKVFKKYTGMSPDSYRRQALERKKP